MLIEQIKLDAQQSMEIITEVDGEADDLGPNNTKKNIGGKSTADASAMPTETPSKD